VSATDDLVRGLLETPGPVALERAVLGGCLRWDAAVPDAARALRADDFHVEANRFVWQAVVDLYERGKPVDRVGVADLLERRGQLKDAGGAAYLGRLWDDEPTGAHVAYHAGLVREHSVRRQLAHAGAAIARDAADGADSPEALLERAEGEILRIAQVGFGGSSVPLAAAAEQAADELGERVRSVRSGKGPATGLPTGLHDLDAKTPGLQPGQLVIVAARPSAGKTCFGLHLTRHAALREGVPVFFVSLEMARAELAERLFAADGGVDYLRIRQGMLTDREFDDVAGALHRLRPAPVEIDDAPCQTVLRIGANARRLKLRKGVGLVVIDYLQLIEAEDRRQPRHQQVAGISRRLKLLARELAVPVVVMAQLNRAAEEGPRPKLSHLRESGALEADADVVILLHRDDASPGTVEAIIAKQRNGPTGTVTLAFRREYQRFDNYAVGE
jgi:replicative DNA helicase